MGQYRIKAVARLTGLRPELLRMWERRYRLFSPRRAANRYRVYTEEDVRLLLYIKQQLEQGRAIGELAAEGREALLRRLSPPVHLPAPAYAPLIDELLEYVCALQKRRLDARLRECVVLYPFATLLTEVLGPLLQRLGALRAAGQASLASERLALFTVKQRLLAMLQASAPDTAAPLLLCACPAREQHELGLLTFAYLAHQAGWEVCYLGSNLPLAALLLSCQRLQPALVALSLTHTAAAAQCRKRVHAIDVRIAATYPTLIGGQAVTQYVSSLQPRHAILCPSLQAGLVYLRQHRANSLSNSLTNGLYSSKEGLLSASKG